MHKSLLAAASAIVLVSSATTANAASIIIGPTPSVLTPPASALFGAVVTGTATGTTAINDIFNFTITGGPAITDSQVSTILLNGSQDINFTSVMLDGIYAFTKTSVDDMPDTWALVNPVLLTNGTHNIDVMGTLVGSTGAYAGTINVQVPRSVPEAKTWMMMLLGFGAMGLAIRRRQKPVLAQIA